MKKLLIAALLAGGLVATSATAAFAHTAHVTHHEICTDEGDTQTVVTFDNDYGLTAVVTYHWGSDPTSTVNLAQKPSGGSNPTVSLPSHAVGTLKYHVTWSDNYRQPTEGDSTLTIGPLTNCHEVTTTSSSTTSTSTTSTTLKPATITVTPPPAEAPAAAEKAVVPTEVKGVQLTAPAPAAAPAPVGGVQTGGGGTSQSSNHLLPIGFALGLVGLVGLVTMQLRRRVS